MLVIFTMTMKDTEGLCFNEGFVVSEVTSGLTLNFQRYESVQFLVGYIAMVTCAAHLTCSEGGYGRDNRSTHIKAAPTRKWHCHS